MKIRKTVISKEGLKSITMPLSVPFHEWVSEFVNRIPEEFGEDGFPGDIDASAEGLVLTTIISQVTYEPIPSGNEA